MRVRPAGYLTCSRCEGLYAQGRVCPCATDPPCPRGLRLLVWGATGLFCVLAWAGVALCGWWVVMLIGGK